MKKNLAKIAVVADEDVATFFRASGVKMSYGVKTAKEAEDLVWKIAENKDVVILIVTEKIADEIKSTIDEISKRIYPTILVIPGKEGPIPGRVSPLLALVKRTVGVEIKI